MIGKPLIKMDLSKLDLGRYHYRDVEVRPTKVVGDVDGYASLSDALAAAKELHRAQSATNSQTGSRYTDALAVVQPRNESAFSILNLDSSLLFTLAGTFFSIPEYLSHSDAVVAVMNGDGSMLQNAGRAHWWN